MRDYIAFAFLVFVTKDYGVEGRLPSGGNGRQLSVSVAPLSHHPKTFAA